MGTPSPELCPEAALKNFPDHWREGIIQFVVSVKERYAPVCILLYGSTAKGTHTVASDIDVIVLADNLPGDLWERLQALNGLRPRVPLQVLAYTPMEFERMLNEYSVTALDAVTQGIPLYGQAYFNRLQERVGELTKQELRRTATAWVW